MIKVGIVGYGTIGRRVARAVSIQSDMHISGILKTKPDYLAGEASRDFKVFCSDEKALNNFKEAGMPCHGTLDNLIDDSDIIVDASPEGNGKKDLEVYKAYKKPAIFQGGEEPSIAEASFNAYSNYNDSYGKKYVRVVSCNTTGLARTLSVVRNNFAIEHISAVLVRRGADPNDSKGGPINALEPSLKFPSHHAPDLKTVLGNVDVNTVAIKAPTTLMHVHTVQVEMKYPATAEQITDLLKEKRRILLVSGKNGVTSTAQIMDLAREMGRDRSDLYEIAVWKESITVKEKRLNYIQAIHQESDVVPENVDAIRAMMQLANQEESIAKTDASMNIGKGAI